MPAVVTVVWQIHGGPASTWASPCVLSVLEFTGVLEFIFQKYDLVTLLRLARMNEEMRESEGLYGQPGDETYQDIFRDFSQMASNNPEKLNRFQQDSQKF